jgi:hypothetical protein
MKMHLEWSRPIPLKDGSRENLLCAVDLAKLPTAGGVYTFGRQRKDQDRNFEALYVGKANTIRRRVRGQLKNLPVMLHLKNARQGRRLLLTAKFVGQPGQRAGKCIPIIERALIRYFLSEGHDLVNKQGTRLRRHEIKSDGKHPKRFIPKQMFVDRGRGE